MYCYFSVEFIRVIINLIPSYLKVMERQNVNRHRGRWRRDIGLRQQLAFIVFFIALFLMAFEPSIDAYRRGNQPKMLLSKIAGYKKVAEEIAQVVNSERNPCEDFYLFLCGNVHRQSQEYIAPLDKLRIDMETSLRNIITKEMRREEEAKLCKSARTQRKYYNLCVDTSGINSFMDAEFIQQIEYVTAGILYEDTDATSKLNWQDISIRAFERGFFYKFFMDFSTVYDTVEQKYLFTFKRVSQEYLQRIAPFFEEDNIKALLNAITNVWVIPMYNQTGVSSSLSNFFAEFQTTYQEVLEDDIYSSDYPRTVSIGFIAEYEPDNNTNFRRFLEELTGFEFGLQTQIYNRYGDVETFSKLFNLLKIGNHRLWRLFIVFVLIEEHCEYLSIRMMSVCYRIKYGDLPVPGTINGTIEEDEYRQWREDFCYEEARTLFPNIAEREYVVQTVSNETRNNVQEMTKNILSALVNRLQQAKYMNDTDPNSAFNTWINTIKTSVGWHKIVYREKSFERLYGVNMEAVNHNIIITRQRLFKAKTLGEYKNIGLVDKQLNAIKKRKPIKLSVDAYYEKRTNNIVLLAPLLNPPIYDEYIPAYLNYASLGPIIASLLIKMLQEAYLNKELIRDSDHRAWMIKLSRAQLPDLDCVKDRFNNYPRSASQYVSPWVVSEVITNVVADFHGALVALDAYQTQIEAEEIAGTMDRAVEIKNLTGYTRPQLFWMKSGIYQCKDLQFELIGNLNGTYADTSYQYEAIPSFKINGPRMNSEQFAQAFECSSRYRMNSVPKCNF